MCCCNTKSMTQIDPVCGMTVDLSRAAAQSEYAGKTHLFCSVGCKRKFDAAPDYYVNGEASCCSSANPTSSSAAINAKRAPTMTETDLVCGMKVDSAKAGGSVQYRGKTFYFCSTGCAAKFKADPEKYLLPKQSTPALARDSAADSVEYICPMDPEVHQMRPGACPKCRMALEPTTLSVTATRTEYTCPMHPEIVRSEPGN